MEKISKSEIDLEKVADEKLEALFGKIATNDIDNWWLHYAAGGLQKYASFSSNRILNFVEKHKGADYAKLYENLSTAAGIAQSTHNAYRLHKIAKTERDKIFSIIGLIDTQIILDTYPVVEELMTYFDDEEDDDIPAAN